MKSILSTEADNVGGLGGFAGKYTNTSTNTKTAQAASNRQKYTTEIEYMHGVIHIRPVKRGVLQLLEDISTLLEISKCN